MVPTLVERVVSVATEVKAAVLRTQEVPISKFGVSSVGTPARNARLLNQACATVDDGTIISAARRWYPLDQGVVRIVRGNIELRGPGYQRGGFLYTSIDETHSGIGPGNCITVGSDATITDASQLLHNVTVRGLGFRDLNTTDIVGRPGDEGHFPSALEAIFVENFLLDACGFQNIKGNAGVNILGWCRDNVTPVTQRITTQHCWFSGSQRDGINAAGSYELVLRGHQTNGVGQHFMELGTGVHVLTVADCVGDMQGKGRCHLASFTVAERGTVSGCTFRKWSNNASAIAVNPDVPSQPVYNFTVEDCTLESDSGIAAIDIANGDLRNHTYRRNHFGCILPFNVGKTPDGLDISENDGWCREFIASSGSVDVGVNTMTLRAA